jgi:hypothetical protein
MCSCFSIDKLTRDEVPPGVLKPRDGFVAVDLVEPGCEPLDLFNPVTQTQAFKETVPWIVIRVGTQADPIATTAS